VGRVGQVGQAGQVRQVGQAGQVRQVGQVGRVGRAVTAAIALGLAIVVAMAVIEVWVRATWDRTRGTPGFFLSDPRRGQRLAPGYDGWFAGVPVHINSLGFRDSREYTLEKPPGTIRILVIGDSVTFGHGATFETTYPYLLEQRLEAWRPEVRWEVWNLGVPGYNTRQELTYLQEIGPTFQPDLVIIGFYPNDYMDNVETASGWLRTASASGVAALQRHVYSFELYKRAYLTLGWKLSSDESLRLRIKHLQTEADLLVERRQNPDAPEQRLTEVERLATEDVRRYVCAGVPHSQPGVAGELALRIRSNAPELQPWLSAVRELQGLAHEGTYRLMFFINTAPETCGHEDRFYRGPSIADEAALLEVLGAGTPVVSSGDAFLHYRPSQMPLAAGHSLGNSNQVKADVLYEFLREHVLPDALSEERSR
jgi:GDSL-like Lipase/Acylhydrolase family